jgi:hypothetical protein
MTLPVFEWAQGGSLTTQSYLALTRDPAVSGVYILPLLVCYELGVRVSHVPLRNAAELMLKDLVALAGPLAPFAHYLVLIGSIACAADVVRRRLPFLLVYVPFLAECFLWAALLGPLVTLFLPIHLLSAPPSTSLWLSIGAGIYEELVFRFFLLALPFLLLKRVLGVSTIAAAVAALLLSSLAFAGYHHVGPFGEPFNARTFCFRLMAGIMLGILFIFRGLGVTTYLHAFYDILRDLESS